jgi:hypothetical protein
MATDGDSSTTLPLTSGGDSILDVQVTLANGAVVKVPVSFLRVAAGPNGSADGGSVTKDNELPTRDQTLGARLDRIIDLLFAINDKLSKSTGVFP